MSGKPVPANHLSQRNKTVVGMDKAGNGLAMRQEEFFSGPLPPPEFLEKYEAILPGLADRVVTMAENQSNHRMGSEKLYLMESLKQASRGQLFAFIIGMTGVIGSIYLLAIGITGAGIATLLLTLGSLVGVFFSGKKKNAVEVEKKKSSEK